MFTFNRHVKIIDKIEKVLLKAKNRKPVFLGEDDSFYIINADSNKISKIEKVDDYLIEEDYEIIENAKDAMILIAENQYKKFIPELYYFLEDVDSSLRKKTIVTLVSFPDELLPALPEKLFDIWSNESEDFSVRECAYIAWEGFDLYNYDKKTITKMYELLKTKKIDMLIRFKAFIVILNTAGEEYSTSKVFCLLNDINKLKDMKKNNEEFIYNENEFRALIDWKVIHSIMEQYAPEALDNDKIKS